MVSICVPTYNHEKYIRRALNSIFMQKTNYTYEILVGEDKSTDNTKQVLKDIENENHKGLKVFYRTQNMNNSGYSNSHDLRDRAIGKYIIYLEGDDFWTDPNKIQMQVDFLEAHEDFIAVAHNCVMVGDDSQPIKKIYKECKDNVYTFKHYASEIMPGQQATVLMRNFKYVNYIDTSFFNSQVQPGDRKMYFTLLCYGKVYCFQKIMSAYRYVEKGGSSWSATHKYNYWEWHEWFVQQQDYAYKIHKKEAELVSSFMLLLSIRQGLLYNHSISLKEFFKESKKIKNPGKAYNMLLVRDFNKFVRKRTIYF